LPKLAIHPARETTRIEKLAKAHSSDWEALAMGAQAFLSCDEWNPDRTVIGGPIFKGIAKTTSQIHLDDSYGS
jgi:hypothetical protein